MGEVASHGRTVLFVSHNMAAVANLCPHSFLLDKGRLAMAGPSGEVIGRYLERALGGVATAEGVAYVRDPAKPIGEAAVTAVRFIPEGGADPRFIESGGALAMEIDVAAAAPDLPLSVFVRLVDRTETPVCKFETDPKLLRIPGGGETSTVRLDIESMPLMPGEYSASVAIAHFGSHLIDYAENAARLMVTDARTQNMKMSPFAEGPVAARHGWRISGQAASPTIVPSQLSVPQL
jgi:lipopolysaccharide transport system ATP-binding protein